jgi:hypothetical protein
MLKLSEFSHNHYPSGVKMLGNFIRRGIWVANNQLGSKTELEQEVESNAPISNELHDYHSHSDHLHWPWACRSFVSKLLG